VFFDKSSIAYIFIISRFTSEHLPGYKTAKIRKTERVIMTKVLIVEDEKGISSLIKNSLEASGYDCVCAYDGQEAADMIEKYNYDLILLDIMLPKVDGYELISYIQNYHIPVIFVSAKGSVEDRVKGLKLGAEDYLVKPFEIVELLARVETVLRRYGRGDQKICIAGAEIYLDSFRVTKDDQEINLTSKEFDLMLLFVRNKNIALFRDKIYELVWGGEYSDECRTVDLHVQRLRKKMNWEKIIVSVHKIGYRLEEK